MRGLAPVSSYETHCGSHGRLWLFRYMDINVKMMRGMAINYTGMPE